MPAKPLPLPLALALWAALILALVIALSLTNRDSPAADGPGIDREAAGHQRAVQEELRRINSTTDR